MAKSLCKYRRAEIADQFAVISRIVSEPKFVCRSCARSASEKGYLCKPSSLQLPKPITKAPRPAPVPAAPVVASPALALASSHGHRESMVPAELAVSLGKKQIRKLKKLAKKKNKRLKKAAKAVKRYEKVLAKAKRAVKLA
ncbi:hypothetical protein [Photobacterium sp. TY1-4]|uniref:hypothetical protein n=1 Tax=Photobacterium sp. TY1-4 TaxID=2899122 RepID=UPI0021BF9AFF|nr:hypothetical protein [Photobacterium sp. TY1-4]UXI01234.1 hypothetical protein NH461_16025 [Photobacterium sp. TY1-4]